MSGISGGSGSSSPPNKLERKLTALPIKPSANDLPISPSLGKTFLVFTKKPSIKSPYVITFNVI